MVPAAAPHERRHDEKTLAILSHLGPILGGFVLPLVLFLVAKDKPYVRHHACEALNFADHLHGHLDGGDGPGVRGIGSAALR